MKPKIALIGLGHHCKRIYISSLKRLDIEPSLIIDLESKRAEVEHFIKERNLTSKLIFIPNSEKDNNILSEKIQKELDYLISKLQINRAIISTEPKAHYAYLQYFITRRISILTDKPITAPINVINDEEQAKKIRSEYHHLLSLANENDVQVTVQCQRRYDLRYQWIVNEVRKFIKEYDVPITHIQISHCDGSLNMPDEFFSRENHPYKYGYGKLFHSGYHFLDLLSYLLSFDQLSTSKRPCECLITSSHYSPHDQLFALDESFYSHIFENKDYSLFYDLWKANRYLKMGELDVSAILEFSRDSQVITTCSLNLLQSGFTRRAWPHLPFDTYKSNGRVRHESLSLQMGPLMNIQVHSYQAHEIKERHNTSIHHDMAGGLEHFDIHVFRNSDIIGGNPHEVIKGKTLIPKEIEFFSDFKGFNEYARYQCLSDFLNGKQTLSTLQDQMLTIDLITNTYISMCRKRHNDVPISSFKLNDNNLLFNEEYKYDSAEFCSRIYS